jgi:transglutaminase-like putative cysteine protease
MKLQVYHRTHYLYGSPVKDSFNEARLRPASEDGQICHRFVLKVLPATRLTHYLDFQKNYVHLFDISEPHRELTVEAVSTVTTTASRVLPPNEMTTPLTAMPDCGKLEGCHDFLQTSRYIDQTPEVWRLGVDITAGVTDTWHAVQAIMHHIHREFAYKPGTTQVHTLMSEVVGVRCGVCQDFAHVMIGICRSLKIPARYVSGYLYNGPVEHLRGAQASHAWVEIFLPKLGWRGLDPTNDRQPDEHYVKIGVGRDYSDVSPLRGTYRGTAQRKMSVEVLVTSLEPAAV